MHYLDPNQAHQVGLLRLQNFYPLYQLPVLRILKPTSLKQVKEMLSTGLANNQNLSSEQSLHPAPSMRVLLTRFLECQCKSMRESQRYRSLLLN